MNSPPTISQITVPTSDRGLRLDRWLAAHYPHLSRARLQELIEAGLVLLNGSAAKASQKLRGGETITIEARPRPPLRAEPESIPLAVVYEDDDLLIVDKPAGMSVHAGAGNSRGTLVNALLGRGQSLSRGGAVQSEALRPGIVHRLDKQTSGLIVIAKNDYAHAKLADAFRSRAIKKTYIALAEGQLDGASGKIAFPIGRDPIHRTRMKAFSSVAPSQSRNGKVPAITRSALTEWRKLVDFGGATLLEVQLHTGRTHQIRVHLSAAKHPLVGDSLYGASPKLHFAKLELDPPSRQFLHAARLGVPHPRSGNWIEVTAPLAQDLRDYLTQLAALTETSLDAAATYL